MMKSFICSCRNKIEAELHEDPTQSYSTPAGSRRARQRRCWVGLAELADKMQTQRFYRTWDTYRCCEFLRDCTKYLACDGRYKREGWLSKDDRFTGIYKSNYKFRRSWVALLSQIVGYVEMLSEDEDKEKLYENGAKLAAMSWGEAEWKDYVWSTVKGHITTAQAAIDQEPEESRLSRVMSALRGQKANLDALKDLA